MLSLSKHKIPNLQGFRMDTSYGKSAVPHFTLKELRLFLIPYISSYPFQGMIEKETCKIFKVHRTVMIFERDIYLKKCNRKVFRTMSVLRTSKILWYLPDYKHVAPTVLLNAQEIALRPSILAKNIPCRWH
jgi:hypothetical protein